MRKPLLALVVLMLVALLAAPVAADDVALIVVDAEAGTVDVSEIDPTGNAPPPIIVIIPPDASSFDEIVPPAQDGVGCAPSLCE